MWRATPKFASSFQLFWQTGNLYPALRFAPWQAIEPANPDSNCISNTLGLKTEIVGFGFRDFSFDSKNYTQLYLSQGFLPVGEPDFRLLAGVEKVVLYGQSPSDPGYWDTLRGAQSAGLPVYDRMILVTHGARQQEDGLFSSKFGDQALIATAQPQDVAGSAYGQPLAIFARPRNPGSP